MISDPSWPMNKMMVWLVPTMRSQEKCARLTKDRLATTITQKNHGANFDGYSIGEKVFTLLPVLFLLVSLIAGSVSIGAAQQARSRQLSPSASQVAELIGVTSLLERLEPVPDESTVQSEVKLASVIARQEITEKVMIASLDIDSVNAVIDLEIQQIGSIRAKLQARRDKTQEIMNVASIVTGGVAGTVASALQFKSSTVSLGNGIGVGGGVGSIIVSIVGIRAQGGRSTLGDSPRMLARFFGRQPAAVETIPSVYPDSLWLYLDSADPGSQQTQAKSRKEQLIQKWRSEGRIKDNSQKSERRIEFLSTSISRAQRLGIDELTDRESMLLDVRARISLMKRDLNEIVRSINLPSALHRKEP